MALWSRKPSARRNCKVRSSCSNRRLANHHRPLEPPLQRAVCFFREEGRKRRGDSCALGRWRYGDEAMADVTKDYIAEVLEHIATMLELKGENVFKVRAYQNAA